MKSTSWKLAVSAFATALIGFVGVLTACNTASANIQATEEMASTSDSSFANSTSSSEASLPFILTTDKNNVDLNSNSEQGSALFTTTASTATSSSIVPTFTASSKLSVQQRSLFNYSIQKITFAELEYASQKTKIIKVISQTDEIQRVEKLFEKRFWTLATETGDWLKYAPNIPKTYVVFIEGEGGQTAVIHLYSSLATGLTRGAASIAQFDDLSLDPEEYSQFNSGLSGFNRYWVDKNTYRSLYEFCL